MKQLITLLVAVLVSIPVNAQILNQNIQETENLKTTKFFSSRSAHKNGAKDIKDRNFIVKRKAEMLKTSSINAAKYLDSLTIQEWDNGVWEFFNNQVFTYENDRLKTETFYYWDGSEFVPYQMIEYTFDNNGNLESEIHSTADYTGNWKLDTKTEYTYFLTSGIYKLELEESFAWDAYATVPAWINTSKIELTYDTYETSVTEELVSEWINDAWMNVNKVDYIYDSGRLSSKIFLDVNNIGEWINSSKWEYFYDGLPKVEEIVYRWEAGTSGNWVEQYKYEYEWEPYGYPLFLLKTETEYIWDTNDWVKDYLSEYQYDNNGNGISGIYYYWNGDWFIDEKDEFYFDLAYDFDDIIGPFYYADEGIYDTKIQFNNMVIGYSYYIYVNQNWVDEMKILFFYSDYTNPLSIDDKTLASSINIYPNPVIDVLNIDSDIPLTKIEVFSILGKKIKEINTNFKTVSFQDMANGIYIVKIQSENANVLKKIIKR